MGLNPSVVPISASYKTWPVGSLGSNLPSAWYILIIRHTGTELGRSGCEPSFEGFPDLSQGRKLMLRAAGQLGPAR